MDFLTIDGNQSTGYPLVEDHSINLYLSEQHDRCTANTLIDTWKLGQSYLNPFGEICKREYFQSLQERASINHRQPKPVSLRPPVSEVIILIKENLPRGSWRLHVSKILSLNKGLDGYVRSANVKTSTGRTSTRPINFLFSLETSPLPLDFLPLPLSTQHPERNNANERGS